MFVVAYLQKIMPSLRIILDFFIFLNLAKFHMPRSSLELITDIRQKTKKQLHIPTRHFAFYTNIA